MSCWDWLLSPPAGFAVGLLLAWLLYRLGGRLAPPLRAVGGKLEQYACGEDIPGQQYQVGYRQFFVAALFFTVLHVAALVAATVPGGDPFLALLGLGYLAALAGAVIALLCKDTD